MGQISWQEVARDCEGMLRGYRRMLTQAIPPSLSWVDHIIPPLAVKAGRFGVVAYGYQYAFRALLAEHRALLGQMSADCFELQALLDAHRQKLRIDGKGGS